MKQNLIKMFEIASLIRQSQEMLIERYHPEDEMKCPIHFCVGQEALAAALHLLVKNEDFMLSHHRSHGYYLAKKCSLEGMIAEFYGKKNGSNSGLAGSQELSFSEKNFYSGTILSGMFSISLGTSYAQKINKKSGITFTIIGDGGMEEGICFETLNMASLHSLPTVFICENNNFSVHTNISERNKFNNFRKKINSFGIEYILIDTHKIDRIFKILEKKINTVRKKKKPIFIEFNTQRFCSHVGPESDDKEFDYRNSYLKKWLKRDCVKDLEKKIPLSVVKKIYKNNNKKINLAINKARNASVLNYEKSIQFNFSKKYSNIIKKFAKNNIEFKGGQKETKLKPY